MQTRPTDRLSKKLAKYAHKHSLNQTARKYGIIDPHGKPSRGLVSLIIDGYEPKRTETRLRLGLPARIRFPRPRPTINDLFQLPIKEMPPEVLRYALEHREEYRA
jgi:hypothetical protein